MQEDPPPFDLIRLEGDTLILSKRGGTWKYDMRPEEAARHMPPAKRAHLENAQKAGWNILGVAIMDRLGEKGMKLREVLI